MAYLESQPVSPDTGAGAGTRLPPVDAPRVRRKAPAPRLSWVAASLGGLVCGLLFALAYAKLEQPGVALIVTILVLLPAASLFGGDGQRR